MVRKPGPLKTALLVVTAGCLMGANIRYVRLEKADIEARLRAVSNKNPERERTLLEFFQTAGCAGQHLTEQPVKHVKLPNIVCTMPAEGARVIIVGAHFDHVSTGLGVVDNWSGAVLLPSLYQSLKQSLAGTRSSSSGSPTKRKACLAPELM